MTKSTVDGSTGVLSGGSRGPYVVNSSESVELILAACIRLASR